MGILDRFRLDGETAVVTGGARGLGRAMAQALAEAGANLCIIDLNGDGAQKAADEIAALGVKTQAIEADITNEAELKELPRKVMGHFGRVDILVNNAGIVRNEPAEEMSRETWDAIMELNTTAVFRCSQEFGRLMIQQKSGKIINIASMSGLIVNYPQPQVSYNASKAAVIMITRSMAAEWAKYNIRVNAIAPGYMETDLTAPLLEKPGTRENWVEPTPMKRMGKPHELGGAVVYLASEASSFTTGHTLVVDGGYTIY